MDSGSSKNKTIILVDCHSFDKEKFQGVNTYILELYKEVVPKNQNINYYFCARESSNIRELLNFENSYFIKLKSKHFLTRMLFEFPRLIKIYNVDFAHFQYKVPLFKRCKEIVTTHDVLFLDYPSFFSKKFTFLSRILYGIALKRAEIIFTVSSYSKKRIAKHYGIQQNKINVTPLGVRVPCNFNMEEKIQLSSKLNIPKNYILYVSRIEPRKNHYEFIQIFIKLTKVYTNIKLILVGSYTVENPLIRNLINTNSDKIQHYENLENKELDHLYQQALLSVFPSKCEGFGLPPLESIANNCPCVSSNTTAMGDYQDLMFETFNPEDSKEIYVKLEQALEKLHAHREIKLNSLPKKYSWKSAANIYLNSIHHDKF